MACRDLFALTFLWIYHWNFWENWAIWEKYKHLAIANDARLASLKAFFILEQRNIYTWLYVPVTGHITIRHILRKNKSMRSELQNIGLTFDVLTPNYLVWFDLTPLFFKQMWLNELTQAKLVSWWHVPLIVHVTIWKFRRKIEISERTGQFETNISI